MPTNQHIREFLEYYINLTVAPQYAVIIKGDWGSGKTHFINTLREKANPTPLYVSLNGLSSIKEIEQEFFRQLHPVLSNPKLRLAAKLIQGAVKTTVNIDLNSDTKPEGNTQVGLPDIDFSKYSSGPNGFFIIFDDLERCQIPIPSLLGYINYFVEHGKCKVLIAADEDRITAGFSNNEKGKDEYKYIREKVIGKTFELAPDIDGAIREFSDDITNIHARTAVRENVELIKEILKASKYKNLRQLRQALLEFSRLVDCIQVTNYKKEMLRSLLGTLTMYSLETGAAFISHADIGELHSEDLFYRLEKTDGTSRWSVLNDKYGQLDVLNSFIPETGWRDLFSKGAISLELLHSYVQTSKYYARTVDRPIWLRLWEMYSSNDAALQGAVTEADTMLKDSGFHSPAELLNIVGSLLDLSEYGVYTRSVSEIERLAKGCIEDLAAKGQLQNDDESLDLDDDISFGRRHHSRESPEYRAVKAHLKSVRESSEIKSYPSVTEHLFELLCKNVDEFGRQLNSAGHDTKNYLEKPILAYADVNTLCRKIEVMEAVSLSKLAKIIHDRYRHSPEELSPELDLLTHLEERMQSMKITRRGTMAAFWLNVLHEELVKITKSYRPN